MITVHPGTDPLLRAMFAPKAPEDAILIWTLPSKHSTWIPSTDVDIILEPNSDAYFGVGTRDADAARHFGRRARGKSSDVTGIGAVWIDIDIAGAAHQKNHLPATHADALQLADDAFHTPPSFVVDSGHGLHLYFLLDEWLNLRNGAREDTQATLMGVAQHWRATCAKHGFDADSVHDLSRVLRLPGTINRKLQDAPRPVTIITANPDARYPLALFQQWASRAPQPPPKPEPKAKPEPEPEATDPDAPTFADMWEALCAADPRAKASFLHNRPDLMDQSPSSYDMSLAAIALRAGWTHALTMQLLQYCRAHHANPPKPHALRLTIDKVSQEIATAATAAQTAAQAAPQPAPIIDHIIRYDSTPPAYVIITPDGTRIAAGTIDTITDQRKFRNAIAAGTGILPPAMKPAAWDKAAQAMLNTTVHESAGPEATDNGQTLSWIQAYLESAQIHTTAADGLAAGEPFISEGHVHITGTALRAWLTSALGERTDSRRLALALRAIDAAPVTVELAPDKPRRAAWRIPQHIWTAR
jgi:hypothetical protein